MKPDFADPITRNITALTATAALGGLMIPLLAETAELKAMTAAACVLFFCGVRFALSKGFSLPFQFRPNNAQGHNCAYGSALQRSGRLTVWLRFYVRVRESREIRKLSIDYFDHRFNEEYRPLESAVWIDKEEHKVDYTGLLRSPATIEKNRWVPMEVRTEFRAFHDDGSRADPPNGGFSNLKAPYGTDYGRGILFFDLIDSEETVEYFLNSKGQLVLTEDEWKGPKILEPS